MTAGAPVTRESGWSLRTTGALYSRLATVVAEADLLTAFEVLVFFSTGTRLTFLVKLEIISQQNRPTLGGSVLDYGMESLLSMP